MSQKPKKALATPQKKKYCRLCLHPLQNNRFKQLFGPVVTSFSAKNTIRVIEHLTGVKILESDKHSKLVCFDCWNTASEVKRFKYKIQKSNKKLNSPKKTVKRSLKDRDGKLGGFQDAFALTLLRNVLGPQNGTGDSSDSESGSKIFNVRPEAEEKNCFNIEDEIKNEFVNAPNASNGEALKPLKAKLSKMGEIKNDESVEIKTEIKEEVNTDKKILMENKSRYTIIVHHRRPPVSTEIVPLAVAANLPKSKFNCPICNQIFPSYNSYVEHRSSHAQMYPVKGYFLGPTKVVPKIICAICNQKFENNWQLDMHNNFIHQSSTNVRDVETEIRGVKIETGKRTNVGGHLTEIPINSDLCQHCGRMLNDIPSHTEWCPVWKNFFRIRQSSQKAAWSPKSRLESSV